MGGDGYTLRNKSAKPATEYINGRDRSDHRWFYPVLLDLQKIFPRKLAPNIAVLANRSERVCEVWISKKGAPDGEALAALLNSRFGDRLWQALTRGSTEPWRKKLNRQIEISQLREQQRETILRLEALERGEA